jgi:hypothetical protein
MRLNERGSLFTGLHFSNSRRKGLGIRRTTFYLLFLLSIWAAMIVITLDLVSFRVSVEAHSGTILFLILIPWFAVGMSRRRKIQDEGATLTTLIGLGCLVGGPVFLQAKASTIKSSQFDKLRAISRATFEYASDHSDTLPIANVWMDSISDRVSEEDFTLGKNIVPPQQGYHVAMNSDFSSTAINKIERPDERILYFISHKADRNANDALHSRIENTVCAKVSGSVTMLGKLTSSKP